MIKANTSVEIKHHIECPYCHNGKHRVDHLFSENDTKTFGQWHCSECGGSIKGEVRGKDVFVEQVQSEVINILSFLKYGNMVIVIKDIHFGDASDPDMYSKKKYIYEEHSCPLNYFKSTQMIIDLQYKDTDPHGLFEYLGSIPFVDIDSVDNPLALIPLTAEG